MQQLSEAAIEDAAASLLAASRALIGVAARSVAELNDVTLPQFRALVVLASRPTIGVTDLAQALDIHPTTATRLTDRLVRKGLARRTSTPEDRRVTALVLTAAGRRIVRRVSERRMQAIREIVARVPAASLRRVLDGLAVFADAAGESGLVDPFAWDATT